MIPYRPLYPLVTALLSNILAQVLKTVVYYYRTGKWDFHWVIASGRLSQAVTIDCNSPFPSLEFRNMIWICFPDFSKITTFLYCYVHNTILTLGKTSINSQRAYAK